MSLGREVLETSLFSGPGLCEGDIHLLSLTVLPSLTLDGVRYHSRQLGRLGKAAAPHGVRTGAPLGSDVDQCLTAAKDINFMNTILGQELHKHHTRTRTKEKKTSSVSS